MSEEPLIQFQGLEQESDLKHAVKTLLDPQHAYMTTELHNPLAITALETFASALRAESRVAGELLAKFVDMFKLNMIAYQRKRAEEAIRIARASTGVEESTAREKLRAKILDVLAK